MNLHQLGEARSLTQVNLAKVLNVNQGAVSKMEKRTDMYLYTAQLYQSDGRGSPNQGCVP
jgi:DNA-binding XRE family transcriptional regulator